MSELRFDWREGKARSNVRKHRVTFEEARTVFDDPDVLIKPDIEHSTNEDRAFALGLSFRLRLLLVVFAEMKEDLFRIVSARRATTAEQRQYEEWKAKRH